MSTLFGQEVQDTYKSVLTLDNGFIGSDGSIWPVQTGDGVDTALSLGTDAVKINGLTYPVSDSAAGYVLKTDGAGTLSFGPVVATNITVSDAASDTTTWVVLAGNQTGSQTLLSDGGLSYNASTNALTAVTFIGDLTGNVTGNLTGNVTGNVTGNLTGNVTGNVSGSSGSCTGNAATVTTNANMTGPITSTGNVTSITSQTGTGTKFVVDTSPTLVTPVLGVATATSINKVAITAPATSATLTIADGQTLTVNGSATITNGTHSGTNTGDQNVFSTIAVAGQSDVVADSTSDTLTLVAGANVTLTTNATNDTVTVSAALAGGSTLADGDYGDVTASGSGTTITIDNDVVTYAKMQNVSATDKLLGRSSVGAGDVEEITCTAAGRAILDDADAAAQRTTLSAAASGANTDITSIYLNNTGLKIKDTNASHGLIIAPGSDITADRTLTLTTGDADRTLTISGNTTLSGGSHSGTNTGDQTNITGNAGTVTVADAGGDTTTWPLLGTSQTGSLAPATDAGLTYDATANSLTTTTFVGALTGNSSTATALQTARAIGGVNFDGTAAITPANITIANEATDTTCFPLFTTAATGDLPPKSNASLTFNSSTANLGCTTFTGALVGNASTATSAATLTTARAIGGVNFDGSAAITPANITIANEATDTTCFPLFTTAATGDLPPKSNANLTFNSSTGDFTATSHNSAIITAPTTTVGGNIKLLEGTNNGTNTITLQAPASTADVTATFQAVTGTVVVTGGTDLTVADGGTGVSSATAYAVLCGGTTSTNPFQSIASVGTSGQVLTSNGAGALPTMQTGVATLIQTQNASTSATIDFSNMTGYTSYYVVISALRPATDGADLWVRVSTDSGSTWKSGASDYRYEIFSATNTTTAASQSTAAAQYLIAGAFDSGTTSKGGLILQILNPAGSSYTTMLCPMSFYLDSAGTNMRVYMSGGQYVATTTTNGLRFLMSSGNITSGTFALYGVK